MASTDGCPDKIGPVAVMDPDQLSPSRPLTIIGLGNELLSDDGLGIRVVRSLRARLRDDRVAFEELSVGGLQLLDYVVGCRQCIIVDAIITGSHPPGTLYRFVQKADRDLVRLTSSHQIDLSQVLALAKLMGADLPEKLTVYGIEAEDVITFRDGCTDHVARAIPRLVDVICLDVEECIAAPSATAGEWQIIHEAGAT